MWTKSSTHKQETESQAALLPKAVKFSASLPPKYPNKGEEIINHVKNPDEQSASPAINDSSGVVWAKPIVHKRMSEPLRNGQDLVICRPKHDDVSLIRLHHNRVFLLPLII